MNVNLQISRTKVRKLTHFEPARHIQSFKIYSLLHIFTSKKDWSPGSTGSGEDKRQKQTLWNVD